MTATVVLELTLRGVEIRQDTIALVRRCCRALSPTPPHEWDRVSVYLERMAGWRDVRAHVRVDAAGGAVVASADARDERLAVRGAFEILSARLLLRPYARRFHGVPSREAPVGADAFGPSMAARRVSGM